MIKTTFALLDVSGEGQLDFKEAEYCFRFVIDELLLKRPMSGAGGGGAESEQKAHKQHLSDLFMTMDSSGDALMSLVEFTSFLIIAKHVSQISLVDTEMGRDYKVGQDLATLPASQVTATQLLSMQKEIRALTAECAALKSKGGLSSRSLARSSSKGRSPSRGRSASRGRSTSRGRVDSS